KNNVALRETARRLVLEAFVTKKDAFLAEDLAPFDRAYWTEHFTCEISCYETRVMEDNLHAYREKAHEWWVAGTVYQELA
ncbi:hypothetical protein BGZ76_006824, partial [Entomortierella beljakovae]